MLSAIETKTVRILEVEVTDDTLTFHLDDGRSISAPVAWYPRLAHGTNVERQNYRFIGRGEGVHWPDLDEDISALGVLEGLPSREGAESFRQWLEARQHSTH